MRLDSSIMDPKLCDLQKRQGQLHHWTGAVCQQWQGTRVRAAAVEEIGSQTQLQQFYQWLLSNGTLHVSDFSTCRVYMHRTRLTW